MHGHFHIQSHISVLIGHSALGWTALSGRTHERSFTCRM